MPPAKAHTDPDLLLRDAVTRVAVAAYARGIGITAHVDNRMPARVVPEADGLGAFICRGMQRTVEAGHTSKIGLALWLDEIGSDGEVKAVLEIGRALDDPHPPVVRLGDLWALPLDGATVRPLPGRQDPAAESVLLPVRLAAAPAAPPTASRWGGVFRGRRIMHARDVLFDRDRLRRSMDSVDAEVLFAPSPDEALAALRAGAAAGEPVDIVLLDGHDIGCAALDLARRIRSEPDLAGTRIVAASALRSSRLAAEDAALFDAIPPAAAPRRRLLDVLAELLRGDGAGLDARLDMAGSGAAPGGAPSAVRAEADAAAAIPDLSGRRILIAEDVATNQVLLQAMLRPTGAAVEVFGDGAALLERHRAAPAELILMDLQMPGMGGLAAIRHLRALDGAAGAIPVVALTAYARRADRKRAFDAGTDAYLAKPVVVSEFYALLRRLLPQGPGGQG